ncbi:MAG: lactate utilization protein [Desulfovibrio sp.]|nr:lactate utilization protein [Desulfovibrio sp.]
MNGEAKNEILAKIRAGKPASQPLPDFPMYPYEGDPEKGFIDHLLGFDGRAIKFRSREDAVEWLKNQPEMEASKIIYSSVPYIEGNFGEDELADLREAQKIETCVTESEMGVGETGSVWVTDKSLRHPVCALLSRRMFVFLDRSKLKGGMHEAYASIKLGDNQYGAFYSGPSATADIEAVRITGAQGPLALTVLLYNCADAKEPPELLISPNADSSVWEKYL